MIYTNHQDVDEHMASSNQEKPMPESIGFYSTAQVARLARIPLSTLYTWKKHGIIKPSVLIVDGDKTIEEGYSYADLTIIRIMRALREDQLDLTSAGVALRHLYERLGPPSKGWVNANVYLVGKRIYAYKLDDWSTTAATQFGQRVEERVFGDLFRELKQQEEEGSILVPRDFNAFVEINPRVMGGQPVVKGTRVPTSILSMLRRRGKTITEIAHLYRPIAKVTIAKAIEYEEFLDSAIA